jgi:hypothetical protein
MALALAPAPGPLPTFLPTPRVSNLVLRCRFRHRAVHGEGYRVAHVMAGRRRAQPRQPPRGVDGRRPGALESRRVARGNRAQTAAHPGQARTSPDKEDDP